MLKEPVPAAKFSVNHAKYPRQVGMVVGRRTPVRATRVLEDAFGGLTLREICEGVIPGQRGCAMGCTETVVSIQNVLLNCIGDRTILVRNDGELTLGGVESQLVNGDGRAHSGDVVRGRVHSGERARGRGRGRRITNRFGENLRESDESEEQVRDGGSHWYSLEKVRVRGEESTPGREGWVAAGSI